MGERLRWVFIGSVSITESVSLVAIHAVIMTESLKQVIPAKESCHASWTGWPKPTALYHGRQIITPLESH
jgi:hypothetical protein